MAACAGNDKPKKDFRSWKLSQSEDMLSPEDIVRQVVRESGMRIAFTRESAADEEDESWEVSCGVARPAHPLGTPPPGHLDPPLHPTAGPPQDAVADMDDPWMRDAPVTDTRDDPAVQALSPAPAGDTRPSPYETPIPSVDPLTLIVREMIPRSDAFKKAAEGDAGPLMAVESALLVVDVRSPDAYAAAHVPSSESLPVGEASRERLAELSELARARYGRDLPVDVVLVGTSRRVLDAQQMWVRLTRVWGLGEDRVRVLEGGYDGWTKLRGEFLS